MKEKAVRWAKKNPALNLYFAVHRQGTEKLLLEMELEYFFHELQKLSNVTVLGLSAHPENALSISGENLFKKQLPGVYD